MIPDNIFDQLKRDEGLRLTAYKDSVGVLTVGYGRNLQGRGISQPEAEFLMHNDVADVDKHLHDALPWTANLDRIRYAVLLNMGFNMGVDGLLTFRTFLSLMQAGRWDDAATDLVTTKWAQQVGDRARRLEQQLRTGNWV